MCWPRQCRAGCACQGAIGEGERVAAVVVPKPGAEIDHAAIDAHCRAHLAGFKSPKELHIVDELPRNPSGKVLKRVLREKLAEFKD